MLPSCSLSKALVGRGAGRAVLNNSNSELEGMFRLIALSPSVLAHVGCILQQDTQALHLTVRHGLREALTDGGIPSRIRSTQFHPYQLEHSWPDAASIEKILAC